MYTNLQIKKQKNLGQKALSRAKGYTIIETMISVSLFVIIVMEGMGALLNANLLHQKSQDMRSVIDSLSFVMEDMSRNLRTGYNYQCFGLNQGLGTTTLGVARSCEDGGWAIAFETGEGDAEDYADQWVYYIGTDGTDSNIGIFKSIDGANNFIRITPEEVVIDEETSGFIVTGAEPPSAVPSDLAQPFVTIRLSGTITFKNITSPFSLQTSVSQRVIDI